MEIRFRECDFFNLWIWLELENVPSAMEQQYIEEIFEIGRASCRERV